jgi:hypothetical protein
MCTFEAVTPAACSRLTLRLYPKQYEADPHGNSKPYRVGSEQWQFEVAGEEPGAESIAGRRDAHAGDPYVLFLLDAPPGAWSDPQARTHQFQIQRRRRDQGGAPVACVKLELTPTIELGALDTFRLAEVAEVRPGRPRRRAAWA